jgi:hypothetical protein
MCQLSVCKVHPLSSISTTDFLVEPKTYHPVLCTNLPRQSRVHDPPDGNQCTHFSLLCKRQRDNARKRPIVPGREVAECRTEGVRRLPSPCAPREKYSFLCFIQLSLRIKDGISNCHCVYNCLWSQPDDQPRLKSLLCWVYSVPFQDS